MHEGEELNELLDTLRETARAVNKEWASILGIPKAVLSHVSSQVGQSPSSLTPLLEFIQGTPNITSEEYEAIRKTLLASFLERPEYLPRTVSTNLNRLWSSLSPNEHPMALQEEMSHLLNTYLYGSPISNIGANISRLLRFPLRRKIGQVLGHGRGIILGKLAEFRTCRMMAGHIGRPPMRSVLEAEYNELKAKMPSIIWEDFKEVTDNVEGAQMLACVAGVCEI